MKYIENPDTIFWNNLHNLKFGSAEKIMIRKMSENEIDIMHISQMVERKKAILVNLQLMVREKEQRKGKEKAADVEVKQELEERYSMEGTVTIGNKRYPKQIRLMNYFRGENAWYLDGKASLFRYLPNAKTAQAEYFQKQNAAKESFYSKLSDEDSIQRQTGEEIYGKEICRELVSHHYGYQSEWQEFTSNFDEALFYACCIYEDRHWRPLNKQEIATDHKYGVIYSASADNREFYEKEREGRNTGLMIPAGEVPFMRCHPQYSYAMKMMPEDDLRDDGRFECLVFEHTEAMCQAVFQRMGNGKLIFRKHVRNLADICEMQVNS